MLHDGLYEQIINRGLDAELGVTEETVRRDLEKLEKGA